MVTHHTASPIAANARGRSHTVTSASRPATSPIAVTDHRSALAAAAGSPICPRFHTTRHGTQQNRACSRRGTNTAPHWAHWRLSAINPCYAALVRPCRTQREPVRLVSRAPGSGQKTSSAPPNPITSPAARYGHPGGPPPAAGGRRSGQSRQRGRSLVTVGKRRPRLRRLDLDDVTAHRQEQLDQLLLLRLRDVELIERRRQMLHDDIELAGRGPHPRVRIPHAPAGVDAGTAGDLTQLIGDLLHEPRDISPCELSVGPVIPPDAGHP